MSYSKPLWLNLGGITRLQIADARAINLPIASRAGSVADISANADAFFTFKPQGSGSTMQAQQVRNAYTLSITVFVPDNAAWRARISAWARRRHFCIIYQPGGIRRILGDYRNGATLSISTNAASITPDTIQLSLSCTMLHLPYVFTGNTNRVYAYYTQSNSLQANTDFILKLYDDSITIAPGTLTYQGNATLIISANKIKATTTGTVYDIEFSDTAGNQYRYPCAEGDGFTVHCVRQLKRAIIHNASWSTQNTLHYNLLHGATLLSNGIYVPYSEQKQKIYNDL